MKILSVKIDVRRLALYALLLPFVFFSCEKGEDERPKSEVDVPGQLAKVSFVEAIDENEFLQLDGGIKMWNFKTRTASDQPMAFSILEVDLKHERIAIQTITPDDGEAYKLQTVQQMAAAADKPGRQVIAAINADYFYWTGEPWGPVVKRGELIRDGFFDSWHGFFGIDNGGGLHIGSSVNFSAVKDELVEAVGGTERLVSHGGRMNHQNNERHPRTVIGYTRDGVVYILVVDGRQVGHSVGMRLSELSEIMWAIGASEALNLDGGGSSTLVIRNQTSNALEVQNRLVDDIQREVANGLAVVKLLAN